MRKKQECEGQMELDLTIEEPKKTRKKRTAVRKTQAEKKRGSDPDKEQTKAMTAEEYDLIRQEVEAKGYAGIGLIMRILHTSANNAIAYLEILKKDHIVDKNNQLIKKRK